MNSFFAVEQKLNFDSKLKNSTLIVLHTGIIVNLEMS